MSYMSDLNRNSITYVHDKLSSLSSLSKNMPMYLLPLIKKIALFSLAFIMPSSSISIPSKSSVTFGHIESRNDLTLCFISLHWPLVILFIPLVDYVIRWEGIFHWNWLFTYGRSRWGSSQQTVNRKMVIKLLSVWSKTTEPRHLTQRNNLLSKVSVSELTCFLCAL